MADTQTVQTSARQFIDIAQPFARASGFEGTGSTRIPGNEGTIHIITHFKGFRADSRPQPHKQLIARDPHGNDRGFDHATGKTTPTGVGRSHNRASCITEQQWQAIRRQYGAYSIGPARHTGVRLRTCAHLPDIDALVAMNINQPRRLVR